MTIFIYSQYLHGTSEKALWKNTMVQNMVLPWNHAISTVIIQVRLSFNIALIFQVIELEYELNSNKYNRWINLLLRRKKFIVLRKHTVPFKTANSAYLNFSKKALHLLFLAKSSNFVSSRTHLQHYQLIIGSLPNSDSCHERLTKHLNVLDTSTPCCIYRSFQTSGNFLKALTIINHSHSPFPEQKQYIFVFT